MGMKSGETFNGFVGNAEVTPLPNQFFTTVIQNIQDINELKLVLHVFWLLSRRHGYPRIITSKELLSDNILRKGIAASTDKHDNVVKQALTAAVKHGILLDLHIYKDGIYEDAYLINSEQDREFVARIRRNEIQITDFVLEEKEAVSSLPQPNIFSLYEENIGLLTPMIVEELKEAENIYPLNWIQSAFKEAVSMNKRSWKYISRILERWNTEGKNNGKIGRYSKEETDPAKYVRGKYGHMVKR
jgi:DnaD/phage-associated family protein